MKIEKLNENQIRCTLTREDLANRELKLSELAYGSEKAKSLFREMMQQASYEFGFEANDIPLMIEAIPVSPDSIVLIITKVEDPEELDTRFAKFAPDTQESASSNSFTSLKPEGADDILNLFQKIREAKKAIAQKAKEAAGGDNASGNASSSAQEEDDKVASLDLTKIYGFERLNDVIHIAAILKGSYEGVNTLYKLPDIGEYRLIISKSSHSPEAFNRICNTLSEYGYGMNHSPAAEAYLEEHATVLIRTDALQKLAALEENA